MLWMHEDVKDIRIFLGLQIAQTGRLGKRPLKTQNRSYLYTLGPRAQGMHCLHTWSPRVFCCAVFLDVPLKSGLVQPGLRDVQLPWGSSDIPTLGP